MKRGAITGILAVLSSGFAVAATAQVSDADLKQLGQIRRCDAITKKSARYACYDRVNRQPAPAKSADRVPVKAAPPPPAQDFGIESMTDRTHDRPAPIKTRQIVAKAVLASDSGIGHWTISLDNGTRWRMLERVHAFVPPRPGQSVRIRRFALGSFVMFVGQQPGVPVQRVP